MAAHSSPYTNWETQTAPNSGRPSWPPRTANWLAANKAWPSNRHAIVGASQGGTGAMMMATFHLTVTATPVHRRASSTVGHLQTNGVISNAINIGDNIDADSAPQLGCWKWYDPNVHANLLVQNNTRLGCTARTPVAATPAAMGWRRLQRGAGSNRIFYAHYRPWAVATATDITGRRQQRPGHLAGQLRWRANIAAALG